MSARRMKMTMYISVLWALYLQWKQLFISLSRRKPSPPRPTSSSTRRPSGSRGGPLLLQGSKATDSRPISKMVVSSGAANANGFQLLLLSLSLLSPFVYLGKNEVFKIYWWTVRFFEHCTFNSFSEKSLGHAETSTRGGSFGKPGINSFCVFVPSFHCDMVKAKLTSLVH